MCCSSARTSRRPRRRRRHRAMWEVVCCNRSQCTVFPVWLLRRTRRPDPDDRRRPARSTPAPKPQLRRVRLRRCCAVVGVVVTVGLAVLDPRVLDDFADPARVLASVLLVEPRRFGVGWRGRVGVAQQRLDGGEDGGDVVNWAPLVLQDVCGGKGRGSVGAEGRAPADDRDRDRDRDAPRQIWPSLYMLGWNIFVRKRTAGALLG